MAAMRLVMAVMRLIIAAMRLEELLIIKIILYAWF